MCACWAICVVLPGRRAVDVPARGSGRGARACGCPEVYCLQGRTGRRLFLGPRQLCPQPWCVPGSPPPSTHTHTATTTTHITRVSRVSYSFYGVYVLVRVHAGPDYAGVRCPATGATGPNTPGWSNVSSGLAANYTSWMEYLFVMQNLTFAADGGLMPACKAKHATQPWLCFMAPHMQDSIESEVFMFNSKYDAWQLASPPS